MKQRIADWLYKFWYNNHTHHWIAFDPNSLREKCRYCETLKKI
jgi:hypothetical protein